ncbi:YybH family protein [Occultella kanbiaonis]|uniref:YybH family protein n=1 Tax=Occultella kanbiaonis TaxID=2675754 RepID=UPI001A99316A|nr:nuclear transport factor 2 family protein [Occultella kanbiaonis]
MADDHPALTELTRMAHESAAAYLVGDLDAYARVLPHADDFTLMPPFGGPTRHGFVLDDETREATRSTFQGGQVEVEVDASYVTDDLAVLAVVERQRGRVGGLPEQDWSLRVTLAFRRDGGQWRLVHRHADALTHAIGWNTLARLARGETPD